MKYMLVAITNVIAVVSLASFAEDMPGIQRDATSMAGVQMEQPEKPAPTARATGTIKAIDNERQVVTLAHGAVPALKWPQMTMGFKVTAAQLKGLKVGDQVTFECRADRMDATIVSIALIQQWRQERRARYAAGGVACPKSSSLATANRAS
ncbi:copper-binding protein [Pseudomonas sp. Q1-7]|uniref:copper-binding protein n=1 Tax=Pseudomonas sp. Q1-7 TaxID=3020843 RepID=UPI003FA6A5CD